LEIYDCLIPLFVNREQTPQITVLDIAHVSGGIVTHLGRGVGLSNISRSISNEILAMAIRVHITLQTQKE